MNVAALSSVAGRIASIQSRFGMSHGVNLGGRLGTGVASGGDFAAQLATAEAAGVGSTAPPVGSPAPTSAPRTTAVAAASATATPPTTASTLGVGSTATSSVGGPAGAGPTGSAFLADPVPLPTTGAESGVGSIPLEPLDHSMSQPAGPIDHAHGHHHGHAEVGPASPNAGEHVRSVPYAELFNQIGERYGVSPRLLAAVARVESNYRPDAVSPAGALGLMQLMPATAAQYGADPWNPESAIDGAARLLVDLHERFDDVDLALGAYNVGPGTISRAGNVPVGNAPNYIRRVHESYGSIA